MKRSQSQGANRYVEIVTMPCNCSGIRMKRCSCKVFGYPLAKRTQNVLLVEEDPSVTPVRDNQEKLNVFLRVLEHLYDKCAGYNLRYCPLRGRHKRDKHFANAAKYMVIMICFLAANFIVFLNLSAKIAVHVYFVFKTIVKYFERYIQAAVSRHALKSRCDETIRFNPILGTPSSFTE